LASVVGRSIGSLCGSGSVFRADSHLDQAALITQSFDLFLLGNGPDQ
jgi:hypothetical protein